MTSIKGLTTEQKAEQYDILMNLIRNKISESDINEQLQLLTLAPQNCSREVLSEYFGVSKHLVRQSRELLKRAGILGKVETTQGRFIGLYYYEAAIIIEYRLIGRTLADDTIQLVESFYQDDMYTRQMPGKKDYVSIGNKVHVQKRLILSNLKELFAEFKNTNPDIKVRNLLILRKIFSISEIICINLLDFVLKVL